MNAVGVRVAEMRNVSILLEVIFVAACPATLETENSAQVA